MPKYTVRPRDGGEERDIYCKSDELEEYLALPMFERFGGGIGVTRMVSAMKAHGIIK